MHPAVRGHAFAKSGFNLAHPIVFQKITGEVEQGFNSEDLVELCRFLLKAREFGALQSKSELTLAQAAEGSVVSVDEVGVTALIDEATD